MSTQALHLATGSARDRLAVLAPARPVQVYSPFESHTLRMTLRPLSINDKDQFLRAVHASQDELDRWIAMRKAGETDDALFERQLQLTRLGHERGSNWRRGAFLDDGLFVGCFNLNAVMRGLEFQGEAQWWVSSEMTSRGLGTEGCLALLEVAMKDLPEGLGLHRVIAHIHPENERSVSLAQRVGFRRVPGKTTNVPMNDRWEKHDVYALSLPVSG